MCGYFFSWYLPMCDFWYMWSISWNVIGWTFKVWALPKALPGLHWRSTKRTWGACFCFCIWWGICGHQRNWDLFPVVGCTWGIKRVKIVTSKALALHQTPGISADNLICVGKTNQAALASSYCFSSLAFERVWLQENFDGVWWTFKKFCWWSGRECWEQDQV